MEKHDFSSRMSRKETAAVLCWLPVHGLLLPLLLVRLFPQMGGAALSFWVYVIGTALLVPLCLRFLRRDFDRLCDRPGQVLLQLLIGYFLMLLGSELVGWVLELLQNWLRPEGNPNQEALTLLAAQDRGKILAISLFLAPLVEELIFRGGVYGLLRRRSRVLAYAGCILLFSVYHVWQYALTEPRNWLYLLQYLPSSYVLCRCYEKTETIWAPLLFHMLNNALALLVM